MQGIQPRSRPRSSTRRSLTAAGVAALCLIFVGTARAADPVPMALPAAPGSEAEPNGTAAEANEIASGQRVRGMVDPRADIDRYRFTAEAGDLVFAATVTNGSARSADSRLRVLDADGTTVIEDDDDDASQSSLASSIAGAEIPADGTYYLEVRALSTAE